MAEQTGAVSVEALLREIRLAAPKWMTPDFARDLIAALERIPELTEERDAMQRRAEVAESDWQAAEKRAERLEVAAREADRAYVAGLESEDADGVWQTAEWSAFTAAMTALATALAPAPEGSDG